MLEGIIALQSGGGKAASIEGEIAADDELGEGEGGGEDGKTGPVHPSMSCKKIDKNYGDFCLLKYLPIEIREFLLGKNCQLTLIMFLKAL